MRLLITTADKQVHIGALGRADAGDVVVDQWEPLQLGFYDLDGARVLLTSPTIVVSLKASKDADELLASVTGFTAPETAAGYYNADLSLITDQLATLPGGSTAYLEVKWTVASKVQRSDPLKLQLVKPLTTDEDAMPTDGSAAARAAFLAQYVLAGTGLTATPNTGTGTLTLAGVTQAGITSIAINAADELVVIKNGVELWQPMFRR